MTDFVSSQIAWSILGVILLVASVAWVVLCVKGKIPDPWAKWTLLVAGALGTFGGWLLWVMFTKKKASPPPDPVVVVKKGPSEREVEDLKKRSEDLDKSIEDTEKELDRLDEIEKSIKEPNNEASDRDPSDDIDPDDLNSAFRKRAREAREKLRGSD